MKTIGYILFFILCYLENNAQVAINHTPTKYDSLFKTMNFNPLLFEEMNNNPKEKEKYALFLNEICKLYKEPVTTEDISCKEYKLKRLIICGEKTEIFENRVWSWGGNFYLYNTVFALKEEDFSKRSSESIKEAIKFRENLNK
jgi:hypothetical protein